MIGPNGFRTHGTRCNMEKNTILAAHSLNNSRNYRIVFRIPSNPVRIILVPIGVTTYGIPKIAISPVRFWIAKICIMATAIFGAKTPLTLCSVSIWTCRMTVPTVSSAITCATRSTRGTASRARFFMIAGMFRTVLCAGTFGISNTTY